MKAPVVPMQAVRPAPRPAALTEQIAEALRAHDIDRLGRLSPAAGCLIPVLTALRLESRWIELIESLPHRSERFDLSELRNTLVNLGVDSTPHRLERAEIDPRLLPCVLRTDDGKLRVIVSRTGEHYLCYLAEENRYDGQYQLTERGTVYYFTDLRALQESAPTGTARGFLTRIVDRFRPMVGQILVATAMINLIAILPPLFIMMVYDHVIGAQYEDTLVYLVAGLVAAISVEFGLRWTRSNLLGRIAARLDYLVSTAIFKHLMKLPPLSVERADLWAQLNQLRQFDGVREFLSGSSTAVVLEAPFVVLYIAVIYALGGPLALVPVAMLVLIALLGWWWLRIVEPGMNDGHRARGLRNQRIFETLSGLTDLKALGLQKTRLHELREINGAATKSKLETSRRVSTLSMLATAVTTAAGIAMLGFGALSVMAEELSIGALIACMVLIWRAGAPAQGLLMLVPRSRALFTSARQIDGFMSLAPEPRSTSSTHLVPKHEGAIAFRGVSFRYGPEDNPALAGLTLDIDPGDLVVVNGPSGAGKSTLLKLIARMYRAQSGGIYVDGVDLRQVDPIELRRIISYLPHDPHLFQGTIAENLRLNEPIASDEDLRSAASDAGVLAQIELLPEGFDTMIDAQRLDRVPSSLVHGICLARAYLRDCPILLLDEPGAHLDFESDRRLMRTLEARKGKQTIILSTHRPSHARLATRVIELRDGLLLKS